MHIASDPVTDNLQQIFGRKGAIVSISGPDGSGKSTLTRQLVDKLSMAGVPTRHVHCFKWYEQITIQPLRLLFLRHKGYVVICDRTIVDNVLELARKLSLHPTHWRWLLQALITLQPRFDYRITLLCSEDDLAQRRPEESCSTQQQQLRYYNDYANSGFSKSFYTSGPIFTEVLEYLCELES